MAQVRVKELGFRYPGASENTLSGLTFDVQTGGAHALLGASGAGKTTMLSLLSGLLTPTEGQIFFDDRDVTQLPPNERNVAQVFQFPVLYEGMNVLRNLTFPLRQRGWSKPDATARAREIALALGVDDFIHDKTHKLSLFQKQLVAVGRAIVRPDVALVLLDEPLTAVQPSIKWQLRKALKEVQRELGVTMVYVTHDQTEALTFAEEVSVLAHGRLLQSARGEDLYNEPTHEFVAGFVGSPGMNLIDVEVRNGEVTFADTQIGRCEVADGPARLGCRAEWVVIDPQGSMDATVLRRGQKGTRGGDVAGVADVRIANSKLSVAYLGEVSDTIRVRFDHYLLFRDGVRVA